MNETAIKKAHVRVPASTSNLGAGFDCIGVAVDRWLGASVEVSDGPPGIRMKRSGANSRITLRPEDDLVHIGFALACDACNAEVPRGLEYEVTSTIPVARGLGASAAALVAGAFLARGALGLDLTSEGIAALCAREEGHPDNAGPSVFGGAVLGIPASEDGFAWAFSELRIHHGLVLVFAVPQLEVLTAEARAVLPKSIPHVTAVRAAAKAAALVEGLSTADEELLRFALDDVLHVPFRRRLIPGYDSVVAAAITAGAFGATLSGSGSTMVAVAPREAAQRVGASMQRAWQLHDQDAEVILGDRAVEGASLE
jgi:homoserine kinase